MRAPIGLVWLALGLTAASVPSCFKPETPACAFSCAEPPHTCPATFVCGPEGLCHDPATTGVCASDPGDPGDAANADMGPGGDAGAGE